MTLPHYGLLSLAKIHPLSLFLFLLKSFTLVNSYLPDILRLAAVTHLFIVLANAEEC